VRCVQSLREDVGCLGLLKENRPGLIHVATGRFHCPVCDLAQVSLSLACSHRSIARACCSSHGSRAFRGFPRLRDCDRAPDVFFVAVLGGVSLANFKSGLFAGFDERDALTHQFTHAGGYSFLRRFLVLLKIEAVFGEVVTAIGVGLRLSLCGEFQRVLYHLLAYCGLMRLLLSHTRAVSKPSITESLYR
jgi:hypothetical protein